jgi:hypothetical protein
MQMSNHYNEMRAEQIADQIDKMTDAEVLDQVLETSTWRSLEGWDEMVRDNSYRDHLLTMRLGADTYES